MSQANDYESLDIFDNKKNKPVPYNSTNTLRKKKNTVSSWSITDNYVMTVNTITKLNVDSKKNPEVTPLFFIFVDNIILLLYRSVFSLVFSMVANLCARRRKSLID